MQHKLVSECTPCAAKFTRYCMSTARLRTPRNTSNNKQSVPKCTPRVECLSCPPQCTKSVYCRKYEPRRLQEARSAACDTPSSTGGQKGAHSSTTGAEHIEQNTKQLSSPRKQNHLRLLCTMLPQACEDVLDLQLSNVIKLRGSEQAKSRGIA
jgi:hypothetical protein